MRLALANPRALVTQPSQAAVIAGGAGFLTCVAIAIDALTAIEFALLEGAVAIGFVATCAALIIRRRTPAANGSHVAGLIRERDAAHSASAAKSRYLASVSHEIRSPLNAIYGYAQLVEHESGVDPREAARVIRRSAEHLTNLVEGLLDIASVEQGIVRIDAEVVRLGPMLEQIAEMFRPQAEGKGLSFRCEMPERLPEFVRMDARRVRQILINLVSNAVKFTRSGEVVLKLGWAGQTATIEVRDTGPGIDPAQHEQAFVPYERLENVAGEGASGAGLGLAITRAIVSMLGGEITVESQAGVGSCFRVKLLMTQVSGVVDRSAAAQRPTGYAGDRRSILLVDDDPDHLALLRCALGELGFDIAQASDGQTALAVSEQGRFDAVILDVSMPGMSGWEAASHLRAVHGPDLAIIMLSANASERHGEPGHAPDHDRFLVKPIDLTVLFDALGDELGLQWLRPAADVIAGSGPSTTMTSLSPIAREHTERLKSLVRTGHVRALEGEIRSLERADPDARALVARLFDCLDRFDLAALGRTLEEL